MAGDGSPAARDVGAQTHDVTGRATAGLVEKALAARLRTVLPHLLGPGVWESAPGRREAERAGAGDLLDAAARSLCSDPATDKLWLVLAATAARLPTDEDVHEAAYRAETSSPARMALWLLEESTRRSTLAGAVRSIRLAGDHVLVDAGERRDLDVPSTLANFDRLVDVVIARWQQKDRYLRVAWDSAFGCWTAGGELVIPWKTTVVVLGTPPLETTDALAAAAELSGSTFVALADDNFPAASAGLIPDERVAQIVANLSVLKHFSRVATLSEASAGDYRGFVSAMSAQGLVGPDVIACPLGTEPLVASGKTQRSVSAENQDLPSEPNTPEPSPDIPKILYVGDADERSNLRGLLFAAALLWDEGIPFELDLVVSGTLGAEVAKFRDSLVLAGRRVNVHSAVDPAAIENLYASARFSVSPSAHEGMVLSISESLARGVPVLSSKRSAWTAASSCRGVMAAEVSDDSELCAAIRLLLSDDALIGLLRDEITRRDHRSWVDLADNLWECLVDSAGCPQTQKFSASEAASYSVINARPNDAAAVVGPRDARRLSDSH
jgi:glycosyltransferase involved in cell wall biosynthesis